MTEPRARFNSLLPPWAVALPHRTAAGIRQKARWIPEKLVALAQAVCGAPRAVGDPRAETLLNRI